MLLRRFVNAALRLLAREQWDGASVSHFSRLLVKTGGPLCANDDKVPDSLTYHLTDVFLTEFEKALGSEEAADSLGVQTALPAFLSLLKPFVDTAVTCHSSTVYEKIIKNVFEPILKDCLAAARGDENSLRMTKRRKFDVVEDEEEAKIEFPRILAFTHLSPRSLRSRVFKMLFESASREDAVPSRRRTLYVLYQEEKQRKEAAGENSEDEDEDEE